MPVHAAATKGKARTAAMVEMNFMAGDSRRSVDDCEVSGMGHSAVDAVLGFIPLAALFVASSIYDIEAS